MRRIAVTLDALQVNAQALEHAVRLAERMGAELEGIFIEDIDLIEIAALPFVRELRPVSRSENDIDLARMEQELRALARRAERLLSEQAERHNVSWSFRIWRGSIDSDLLAADIGADVLALSRLGVNAEECVFLDDLGINLKPARGIGMQTIKVLNEDQAIKELAQYTGLVFKH